MSDITRSKDIIIIAVLHTYCQLHCKTMTSCMPTSSSTLMHSSRPPAFHVTIFKFVNKLGSVQII